MAEYLEMAVSYDLNTGRGTVGGSINKKGQLDVLEVLIRSEVGAGKDESKAVERDVYHINIRWYPDGDVFEIKDDVGNKGLRFGILTRVFCQLYNEIEAEQSN